MFLPLNSPRITFWEDYKSTLGTRRKEENGRFYRGGNRGGGFHRGGGFGGPRKCTKLPVQAAALNAKFHSSQLKEGQFTARTVTQRTNQQETK
jgi:hypothetical protein